MLTGKVCLPHKPDSLSSDPQNSHKAGPRIAYVQSQNSSYRGMGSRDGRPPEVCRQANRACTSETLHKWCKAGPALKTVSDLYKHSIDAHTHTHTNLPAHKHSYIHTPRLFLNVFYFGHHETHL